MSMLAIVLLAAAALTAAYFTYGSLLVRLFQVNPDAKTPAVDLRDDVDYAPLAPNELLSQHFSAIAAAGPIVGPILAGVTFGWIPALCWILVGSIFVGGLHDFSALMASIRHQARSMAEVVREHVSRRAFLLFLSFVWLALVYIVVAFTDITARSFVGKQELENGEVVSGGGIASSSVMYLALPIIMGMWMRFGKLPIGLATIIFLPLVGVSIWAGQRVPFDLTQFFLTEGRTPEQAQALAVKTWDLLLLVYCCIASVAPVWMLLQPRGHLGGYFLYAALIGGALGLILQNDPVRYDGFTDWQVGAQTLFPMLFITIACGACSGFHSLIASGTTSKQLRSEKDARLIGYGAMLLEGMVAVVSLCCVMRLAKDHALVADFSKLAPNRIYAEGIGSFLQALGVPGQFAVSFALMAFTTFVYDTLDVCTRLGRFIIQELTGWHDTKGRWLGTLLTGGVPAFFVTQTLIGPDGKEQPLWRIFWNLFGASNQLLAALTLLGVTVWLWQTRRAWWVWLVAGIPTVWMYAMSSWALVQIILSNMKTLQTQTTPLLSNQLIVAISTLLVILAAAMLCEAALAIWGSRRGTPGPQLPAAAPSPA
jgi:carbon starvation protein